MVRHPIVAEVNRKFIESYNSWREPKNIGLRLVSECMLKVIRDMKAKGPSEKVTARGALNMSYGTAYEMWMAERFKAAGLFKYGGELWKDNQVNVRLPQYGANGYMDFLLHVEKQDVGVEVKSIGARKFDELIKTGKPAYKSHYYQIMIYLHFLKLSRGWLVYIDREKFYEAINGQEVPRWEIIEVPYNPEVGEILERRLKKLAEHRRNGTEPKKEPKSPEDYRCTWCPYRKQCWGSLADTGKAGGNVRASRIAANSTARRRERSVLTGTKGPKKPK